MKKSLGLFLVFALAISVISFAEPGKNNKFKTKPFVVDPDDTDLVASAWVTHTGLPGAGKSDHALYFQKDDLTAGTGYAAAQIKHFKNRPTTDLTELGFEYKNGGHCTALSPRFVVRVDGVDHSLGCSTGLASPSLVDPINWTNVRFGSSELVGAGIPALGTIESVHLVFDEGTDAGPGSVYLDNIDINGLLMGKPGNGKVPK